MAGPPVPDAHLEQRLRGLILSNTGSPGGNPTQVAGTAEPAPASASLSYNGHEASARSHVENNDAVGGPMSSPSSSKAARKRPNQAQRRQMNAQLSIPIDPRPQPPSYSARPYASQPTHMLQSYSPSPPQHGRQSHSATFRPSNSTSYSNAPSTGTPFSSFQHRQYAAAGPRPPARHSERSGWRQPPQSTDVSSNRGVQVLAFDAVSPRPPRSSHASLYSPGRSYHVKPEELASQVALLEEVCHTYVAAAEIEPAEISEKEAFRARIEQVCRTAITNYEREDNELRDFPAASVQLKCFGSLSSGFATKASDMDLGLLSPLSHPQPDSPTSSIPRLIEKAFLDLGLGARLLTRTRVPIIKLCEAPPDKLLADLREERTRWEQGLLNEGDGMEDEVHEDVESAMHQTPKDLDVEIAANDVKLPHAGRGKDNAGNNARRSASFQQSDKQSLQSYYSMAKRYLRKIGGSDITHSNARDLTEADFTQLDQVSRTFVRGLLNGELRRRLQNYASLSDTPQKPSMPTFRSLLGVYTQAEGEEMVMLWEARSLKETSERAEEESHAKIRAWTELQNKPTFGLDLLSYNKELQFVLDQLKKIPSIQIMQLSQAQYEPATEYHSRAIKLLVELGGNDTSSSPNSILPMVIKQYINGIWCDDVREQVSEFARLTGSCSLRSVARRHKSLQLASEFEKAVGKGFYEHVRVGDIKEYVKLLRNTMLPPPSMNNHFDFVLPVTYEFSDLVTRIRSLKDPAAMAPNQPRDPYRDRLELPKTGVGVQCDINFAAHLALQNTHLLRCYSYTDYRVRPMVLLVKHWAKVRGINSPYRGTLSSYGYVLMVLHYLVNVAQPFVCPNLQLLAPEPPAGGPGPHEVEETISCKGRDVRFWRDEAEIRRLARDGGLNQNRDGIGHLLRGFFEYYAQSNFMSTVPCRGFDWGRDVLSLRTAGGLVTKQTKGWTGAKTVIEVQPLPMPPELLSSPPSASAARPLDDQAAAASPLIKTSQPADGPDKTAGAAAHVPHHHHHHHHLHPKQGEVKEVRHRYLFAIEDPFELDHNVARTVTHNGIVAIRDEFRRAWRIIRTAGKGVPPTEDLLRDAGEETQQTRNHLSDLMDELHGRELFPAGSVGR